MTRRLPKNCFDCNCNIIPPCVAIFPRCADCLEYEDAIETKWIQDTAVDISGTMEYGFYYPVWDGFGTFPDYVLARVNGAPLANTFLSDVRTYNDNGETVLSPPSYDWYTRATAISGPYVTLDNPFFSSQIYIREFLRFRVLCANPFNSLPPNTMYAELILTAMTQTYYGPLSNECQALLNTWVPYAGGSPSGGVIGCPLVGTNTGDSLGVGGIAYIWGNTNFYETWKYPAHPFDPENCPNDSRIRLTGCNPGWSTEAPVTYPRLEIGGVTQPNPWIISHYQNRIINPGPGPGLPGTVRGWNPFPIYPELEPISNLTVDGPYSILGERFS